MAPSGKLQVMFTHSRAPGESGRGVWFQMADSDFCYRISRGVNRTAFCKVGLKKPVGAGLGSALSDSPRVLTGRLFSATCYPDALVADKTLFLLDKIPVSANYRRAVDVVHQQVYMTKNCP